MLTFNHPLPASQLPERKQSSLIGIEVEVENCSQMIKHELWGSVADSSLKLNGIEYVSKVLTKQEVPIALESLYKNVKALKDKTALFSPRTSIHIHSDARWMSGAADLIPLIFFYLLVEDLMYAFVEPHRRKNIFCVKTKETHYLRPMFVQQSIDTSHLFKYAGFNLRSLGEHGTVEFRMLEGTYDLDKINTWVNFIHTIQDYAKSSSLGMAFRREVKKPDRARDLIFQQFSHFFSDAQIENSIQAGLSYFRYLVCEPIPLAIKNHMTSPDFLKSKFYIKNFVRLDK